MCNLLTVEEVQQILQSETAKESSYAKFAKKHGSVHAVTVSNVISGKQLPNAGILKALGLELIPRYQSIYVK